MTYAFYISAILFPMLSGAGFSRAFRSLDLRAKHRRAKDDLLHRESELEKIDKEYHQKLERLGFVRERAARAITSLGPAADSLAVYVYRLVSLVEDPSAQVELGKQAATLLDQPSTRALSSFLSLVKRSLSLEKGDGFIRKLQMEHFVGLLEASLAAMNRRDLDVVADELFGQIRGQVESGLRYGQVTGFEIFEGESRDRLLSVVELRKYHHRFFSENPGGEDNNGAQ